MFLWWGDSCRRPDTPISSELKVFLRAGSGVTQAAWHPPFRKGLAVLGASRGP